MDFFNSIIPVEHIIKIVAEIDFFVVCEGKSQPLLDIDRFDAPYLYKDMNSISVLGAIWIRVVSTAANFVCSYRDVFIMAIGMGLSKQFELFNNELKRIEGEVKAKNDYLKSLF